VQYLSIILLSLFICSCSKNETSVMDSYGVNRSDKAGHPILKPDFSNLQDPKRDDIKVSDEAKEALLAIYGGFKWKDERLMEFLKSDTGYVTPAFEKHFIENGTDKLLVIGIISTDTDPIDACHACVPLIGGAIFVKQNSKWIVESQNRVFGWGGPFGAVGDTEIVQIGKEKTGILIRNSDMHQGYENLDIRLFVTYQGRIVESLNDGFPESPTMGACEKIDAPDPSFDIKFEPVKDSDYFDVVTRAQFNEGNCEKFERKDITTRYRLSEDQYDPI
jgi:hypothetical protein